MNTRPACTDARGYRGRAYAESLGMAARLLELPACGGHLLQAIGLRELIVQAADGARQHALEGA